MTTKKSFILLLLGIVIASMIVTMFTPLEVAQAQACVPGLPCTPNPDQPKEDQPKKRSTKVPVVIPTKTPTPTVTYTPTVTSTSTSTSTPSSTATALPITGAGAGPNHLNSELPAIQNPGPGSSPNKFPGPLGMIIAVLVILVGLIGGLFISTRRRRIGGNALPYIEKGGSENATVTVPGFGDLGNENATITAPGFDEPDGELRNLSAIDWGDKENFTISVKDAGDISPDAIRDVREAASDPGGVQHRISPPGPPIKPGDFQQPPGPPTKPGGSSL